MLTTNTDILRTSIGEIERGRRAMMAALPGMFDWRNVGVPECGTRGCCWGWTQAANPQLVNFCLESKPNQLTFVTWATRLGIFGSWSQSVFWMDRGDWGKGKIRKALTARGLLPEDSDCAAALDRDLANHMLQLLVKRLRHRLAVCEVEQGEWGRQRKAKDMSVGRAREQAVHEKLQEAVLV